MLQKKKKMGPEEIPFAVIFIVIATVFSIGFTYYKTIIRGDFQIINYIP